MNKIKYYYPKYASREDIIDSCTNYFFSPDTMRFFSSHVLEFTSPGVYENEPGYFFITSEKFDYDSPRLYTIRFMPVNEPNRIDEMGEFQEYTSGRTARRAIEAYVKDHPALSPE